MNNIKAKIARELEDFDSRSMYPDEVGEYKKWSADTLLCEEQYPESEYEYEPEKLKAFIEQSLTTLAKDILEELRLDLPKIEEYKDRPDINEGRWMAAFELEARIIELLKQIDE